LFLITNQVQKACGRADNVIIHYDLVATIQQKQNIKLTSNGVALYNFQGGAFASLNHRSTEKHQTLYKQIIITLYKQNVTEPGIHTKVCLQGMP